MAERQSLGGSSGTSEAKTTKSESEREFLLQVGVSKLLRGALLKMIEARADDPVGFLADHFSNLASESENGTARCSDGEHLLNSSSFGADAQEQQLLNIALWHLRLAHHSQRSAFSNNVRVAYDLIAQTSFQGPSVGMNGKLESSCINSKSGGGVRGGLYTRTLECLCSEGGVPAPTSAPLLLRLHCQDHEAVPYEVFLHGVLTCAFFSDFIRRAQRLYAEVCSPTEGPADRALCGVVLGMLQDALETSQGIDTCSHNNNTKGHFYLKTKTKANRYLEASAKISPSKLAQTMADAQTIGAEGGAYMDAKEFEKTAAELFIIRVRVVS